MKRGALTLFDVVRLVLLLTGGPPLLAGCTWLATRDFDKAVEITAIDIGSKHAVAGFVDLAHGEADLRFVLRGYDCNRPLLASVSVELQLGSAEVTRRELRLDELTWPRGARDCLPIGYSSSGGGRPFGMTIGRAGTRLRYSIAVTRVADSDERLSVWLVYNDRSPVERMIGAGAHRARSFRVAETIE